MTGDEYAKHVKAFNARLFEKARERYGGKPGDFVATGLSAMFTWTLLHGRSSTLMAIPKQYRRSVAEFLGKVDVDDLLDKAVPMLAAFVSRAIEIEGDAL
jgi:hypothetical protein